ncbi:hypothetical protein H7X46_00155 [Pseudonocardia sp. C8]|uniref:hypothetical protein n=1 Tax=Pseudonocardia sp. C8 TaxID=2762759 RepID=UPI00164367C8|nr:hypothetical protein [Pseudonocardia sp. C8]MBC3189482.1 hypothetical protein [Pseudonocardia sp. C8]
MNRVPTTPGLALAGDAILSWQHRYGAETSCLARLRGTRDPHSPDRMRLTVVLSELSGHPRGHYVLSDIAGAATTAVRQLVPGSVDPAAITWLVHHGPFSTPDPSGPETLTRVELDWSIDRYRTPGWDSTVLLDPGQTQALSDELHLQPVDEVLAALPWDLPQPRRALAKDTARP